MDLNPSTSTYQLCNLGQVAEPLSPGHIFLIDRMTVSNPWFAWWCEDPMRCVQTWLLRVLHRHKNWGGGQVWGSPC